MTVVGSDHTTEYEVEWKVGNGRICQQVIDAPSNKIAFETAKKLAGERDYNVWKKIYSTF